MGAAADTGEKEESRFMANIGLTAARRWYAERHNSLMGGAVNPFTRLIDLKAT